MERLVRVPCGLYQGYGNAVPLGQPALSEPKQPGWRQTPVPPAFLARPGLLVPANAPNYCMDSFRRAQLKAVLSQMNPGLGLRLGRVHTREAGVQVSPRVDRAVQCSLGPRTLRSRPAWAPGRRDPQGRPAEAGQGDPGLPEQPREEDAPGPRGRQSPQAPGGAADLLRKPKFQYLDPKYGYFHCKDCKTRWESAYVWCISGTNKVYFKQLCRKCQKSFNPYKVEAIQCQTCSKSHCSCPQKKRHVDLRRPHRQELCGRCKDKRFSCGGTVYSSNYIL
ncbi:ZAR1-like protein [Choloepus didactylus]|uniref:ZAR1-like protein n=1 Tax=Choloepus didactylus TaxID=27675 RepID=UPI00189C9ABA|nr:ZAR1-like protein [Choloepus didactylus]